MKIRNIIITFGALLLSVAAGAQQVTDYSQLRTNTWSIYGLGGVATATGDKLFPNVNQSADTFLAPMGGAGISYNIRPWIRLNLGYEISKYRREQRLAAPQADGLSYRGLEALYNALEFNGELNLAQIFREKGTGGPFNVYLGSGIGALISLGADYAVNMGQEEKVDPSPTNDNYSFTAWLKAHNDRVQFSSPYVPVNLSIEYDIVPKFTVGLRGSLKWLFGDDDPYKPQFIESAGLLLRYNILCHAAGFVSNTQRISQLESELAEAEAMKVVLKRAQDDLAAKTSEADALRRANEDLQKRLADCGADKATINRLMEQIKNLRAEQFTVYFANNSAVITQEARNIIETAAKRILNDPEALSVITASCSTPGSEAYNKLLSQRRAEAVQRALIDAGVPANRITDLITLGEEGMNADGSSRRAIIDIK